jgi:hypothetical protein
MVDIAVDVAAALVVVERLDVVVVAVTPSGFVVSTWQTIL